MRISWFRMYHDARNDAKLRLLSDQEFRIWFNLICMASDQETDQRGSIPIDDDELLAVEVAGGDTKALQSVTARLHKLRIIDTEDGTIVFLNWPGRQYDKPSDLPEAVRARVARCRERKKAANVTSNALVTPSNAPSNANRIGYDSNRIVIGEDRGAEKPPDPPTLLKAVPKPTSRKTPYSESFEVRDAMFNKVRHKHPDLDIDQATEKWANSMRANSEKYRYTDWEAAWYNAMDNAAKWGKEDQQSGGYTDGNGHQLNKRSQAVLRQRDAITRPRNAPERPRDGLRLVTGPDTV